jgi:hypothetical protein
MNMEEYRKIPISKHPPEARKKYASDMKRLHGSELQKGVKVFYSYRGKNIEGIIQKDIGEHESFVIVRSLHETPGVGTWSDDYKRDLATIYGIGERVEGRTTGEHTGEWEVGVAKFSGKSERTPHYTEGPTDMTGKMITHGYSIGGGGGMPEWMKKSGLYPVKFRLRWDQPAQLGLDDPIHHRHLIENRRFKHKHKGWRASVKEGKTPLGDKTTEERDEARKERKEGQEKRERIAAGEYYTGRRGGELRKGASRGPQLPLNPEEEELAFFGFNTGFMQLPTASQIRPGYFQE